MFDDLERQRASEPLRQLLAHYTRLAEPNRDAWQDRLMSLDGIGAPALTKLHGLLIAMDWVELQTGHGNATFSTCYRVTGAGLRAIRQVLKPDAAEESDTPALPIADGIAPKVPRRKRDKAPAVDVLVPAPI